MSALRPVRMFLVGLGVDERTNRMVRFLARSGVDVSLLTFHGYTHDGKTLLARQVRVEPEEAAESGSRQAVTKKLSQSRLREQQENHVKEEALHWAQAYDLWKQAIAMFRENFQSPRERASRSNSEQYQYRRNFQLRDPESGERRVYGAVQLVPSQQTLDIIFHRRAVELCRDELLKLGQFVDSTSSPHDSPEKFEGVPKDKFRFDPVRFHLKSLDDWETHKEELASVARSVYEANEAQLRSDDPNDC